MLVVVFILSISACDMNDVGGEYEYTIDSAITYMEDAGFKVSNETENLYELIGAEDGANIDVGEKKISVELYIGVDDTRKSMFENPEEDKQAFIVSNLYVYIHSDDTEFYEDLKAVFIE